MTTPASPLGRLLAVVAGGILIALGFVFSLAILAVLLIIGLIGGVMVWWKTRTRRRQLDAFATRPATANPPRGGDVFDGEAIVVDDRPQPPHPPRHTQHIAAPHDSA